MKKSYLLLGTAALLGVVGCLWCSAETPPQHLPVPIFVAPKPMAPKPGPEVASTNAARPTVVWCPTCRGRKTVGVEVLVACVSCGGTGKLKSGLSKTETTCNFCKGTGKALNTVQKPCPSCLAKGVLDSTVVEQFVACTNCNGAKMLEVTITSPCATCGGTGKAAKSSIGASGSFGGKSGGKGLGSSLSTQPDQPCPFCHGTGTAEKIVRKPCPVCFGAGIVPPPPPPPPPPSG